MYKQVFHWTERPNGTNNYPLKQESWAIAKMTARCALYMGALKIFGSPWLCPRLLFPKFLMGLCSDRSYKCAYKIWSLSLYPFLR